MYGSRKMDPWEGPGLGLLKATTLFNKRDTGRVTLPRNLVATSGTLQEDFETPGDWTVHEGSVAADAVNVKTGSYSLQVTTALGYWGRITKGGLNFVLDQNKETRVWFYIADASKLQALEINFGGTADVTKNWSYYAYFHTGWNLISIKGSDWTSVGGMTWADPIVAIRFRLAAKAGETAVASLDSLYVNVVGQPAIVITFDDGGDSIYNEGYSRMKTHNIPGTLYAITDNIGTVNSVSAANLLEMQADGWIIANHTKTHADLTSLSQAEAQAEMENAESALVALGITGNGPKHLAYPGGAYNDTVIAAAQAAGMVTGRMVVSLSWYPVIPFSQHPHNVFVGQQFGNTLALAAAEAWADSVKSRGELGIALFHNLVAAPANSSQWGIADFQTFIEYLISIDLPCITIEDAWSLHGGPIWISPQS
jgi:peptidoglycan/xylan/chitin deacetylase (PgdA/CDA1 family)